MPIMHVCLQTYMFSVSADFQISVLLEFLYFHISGISVVPEICKSRNSGKMETQKPSAIFQSVPPRLGLP